MEQRYKILKLITCLALLGSSIQASAMGAFKDDPATLQPATWQFHVTPYLWALNMDGTTQIGTTRAHVDESFSDILNHMDFGGMLWLEANKGRFGVFINALYAKLTDTAQDGIIDFDATAKFGLFSGGLSYKFPINTQFSLSPYVGFRYTLNNNSLTASIPGLTGRFSKNVHWTDPIVGARADYQFTNAWSVMVAGDVGGTNMSTDNSYNVMGLAGYSPQTMWTNTTMFVGYRILKQLYETGSGSSEYVWNMRLAGPLVGVDIRF
jgi:hypothetical protein